MCVHLCENIGCQLRKVLTCSRLLSTCVYLCEQSLGFHFRTNIELFPGPINQRFKKYLCETYWISLQKRLCLVPGAYVMRLPIEKLLYVSSERCLLCSGLLFICVILCEQILNFNPDRSCVYLSENSFSWIHICRCIHTYTYIYIYIHIYVHIHVYMYLFISI